MPRDPRAYLADMLDAAPAQAVQGLLHRLALDVEDAALEKDLDRGFHGPP